MLCFSWLAGYEFLEFRCTSGYHPRIKFIVTVFGAHTQLCWGALLFLGSAVALLLLSIKG